MRSGALRGAAARIRQSLAARLVLLALALLLAVESAIHLSVDRSVQRNTLAQLASRLEIAERVWTRLLGQNAQTLQEGAALLAADYGFRSALASDDHDTIVSALENHGARIGAQVAALLDPDGRVRAVHAAAGGSKDPGLVRALAVAGGPSGGTVIALVGGLPYQLVSAPVRAPLQVGSVVMGFPVGQALLDDMRALSGIDVVLHAGAPGHGLRPLRSTLSHPWSAAMPDAGAAGVVEAGPDRYVVRRVPLPLAGEGGAAVVLLSRFDEAVAPFASLQWSMLLISAAGALMFVLGFSLIARWITTPLRSLVLASERLARGDFSAPARLDRRARRDEVGQLARAFERMRVDIARNEAEIRRLAYQDPLTGLPNRARLRAALAEAIAAARATPGARPLAVMHVDLNRFKHVNDVLGYASGDRLLVATSERLAAWSGTARAELGRPAGNAFVLLLACSVADAALAKAREVEGVFRAPFAVDGQAVDLGAAIGVALWPAHGADADALLSRAEIAMYAAKRALEPALVYDASLDSASAQTLSLLGELRGAMVRGELRIFLQPKLGLADGEPAGAEALVRWQHPTRGLVPPGEFIPFAEQTGFVRHLTGWMLEAVCAWLARRARQGLAPLRVSVNLSARDLLDDGLPEAIAALLARHAVGAGALCLEITESAIIDDPRRAQATLDRLAAMGVKLSIDDFGTGYSSLGYLKRLPVHELKIDRSFVMGMAGDSGDAKIVRSTVDLAHNLGLRVVAEGVEDADTLRRLVEMGCDEAQGYHVGRPMPAEAFDDWLQSRRRGAGTASEGTRALAPLA